MRPDRLPRTCLHPLVALLITSLAACGGGKEIAPEAGKAGAASTNNSAALATSVQTDAPSAFALVIAQNADARTASNASEVGTVRALGNAADVFIQGVPEAPTPAAPLPIDPSGRVFYVDSSRGDDNADGRAGVPGAAGVGPWRTLLRLAQSAVTAGDTVLLACGSSWQETLRLPASGTATHPITVAALSANCGAPPAIDGGQTIASGAWTQHSGSIYKTILPTRPLDVLASSGVFTEAHHPNVGYLTSNPATGYAALPSDGNVVSFNGQIGSNVIAFGAELTLPSGAAITPGTRFRVRTSNWNIDEATVAAVIGNQMTLSTPTTYPLVAGRGYMLLGQLWMLDSPGEWFYDSATNVLYAWLPTSGTPGATVAVTTLAAGIDVTGLKNVIFDGLAVRRVRTAFVIPLTHGVLIRNSSLSDISELGVNADGATSPTLESNMMIRIAGDGISANGTTGLTLRDSVLRDIGVIMQGDKILSLPRNVNAAISSGSASNVVRNTLINTAFTGIRPGPNSLIQDNFVFGACSVLDDSGAIHVWVDHDVNVNHNTIVHSRGSVLGKQAAIAVTQAQGIYLDDFSLNSAAQDNTVIDADNGIQVHNSSNHLLTGNQLYGNRMSQIWLQGSSEVGSVTTTVVKYNQISPVSPGVPGLLLQSGLPSTSDFGTFDANRYYERASPTVAQVHTATGINTFTLNQWRQSSGFGSTEAVDANSTGVGGGGYAAYNINDGVNLVPNAALLAGAAGWSTWNETSPFGQLFWENCKAGKCLRYVAGGSWGLVSSPNFSVVQGQWYRLTVDLATEQPNQYVQIILRRGGGNGPNAWESLTDRDLSFTADRIWGRYTLLFQATKTDLAGQFQTTGDLGARVDFVNIQAGKSITLANLELVTVTPGIFAQSSGALMNVSATPGVTACPYEVSQPALCTKLLRLADNQPLTWPLTLPARSTMLFYAQEPSLIDSDGDGIPDSQDACPGTTAGAAVNAMGCSFHQR